MNLNRLCSSDRRSGTRRARAGRTCSPTAATGQRAGARRRWRCERGLCRTLISTLALHRQSSSIIRPKVTHRWLDPAFSDTAVVAAATS